MEICCNSPFIFSIFTENKDTKSTGILLVVHNRRHNAEVVVVEVLNQTGYISEGFPYCKEHHDSKLNHSLDLDLVRQSTHSSPVDRSSRPAHQGHHELDPFIRHKRVLADGSSRFLIGAASPGCLPNCSSRSPAWG